jgi:hypothetical protein
VFSAGELKLILLLLGKELPYINKTAQNLFLLRAAIRRSHLPHGDAVRTGDN